MSPELCLQLLCYPVFACLLVSDAFDLLSVRTDVCCGTTQLVAISLFCDYSCEYCTLVLVPPTVPELLHLSSEV